MRDDSSWAKRPTPTHKQVEEVTEVVLMEYWRALKTLVPPVPTEAHRAAWLARAAARNPSGLCNG